MLASASVVCAAAMRAPVSGRAGVRTRDAGGAAAAAEGGRTRPWPPALPCSRSCNASLLHVPIYIGICNSGHIGEAFRVKNILFLIRCQ